MAVYTCKMCGGTLNVQPGDTLVTCAYCDTKQSVSMFDTEFSANVLSRAEEQLEKGNFDAAEPLFSSFTVTDPKDPRGWWGVIRCKTKNFSVLLEDFTQIQVWYSHIHSLSPTANALQAQFDAYLQHTSFSFAQQLKQELQEQIKNPAAASEKQSKELAQLNRQLQNTLERFKQSEASAQRDVQHAYDRAHRWKIVMFSALILAGVLFWAPLIIPSILQNFIVISEDSLLVSISGISMLLSIPCYIAFGLIALLKPKNQVQQYRRRAQELHERHLEFVAPLEKRIRQLSEKQNNTTQILEYFSTYEDCDTQNIAQFLYIYRSNGSTSDASIVPQAQTIQKLLGLMEFCPICGRTHNAVCPLCGLAQGQSPAQDAMRRSLIQMGKEEFLLEAERFSTTCELKNFVEEYLAAHPGGIDPRIVELVKKQAKIERTYGANMKTTIKMIQRLE